MDASGASQVFTPVEVLFFVDTRPLKRFSIHQMVAVTLILTAPSAPPLPYYHDWPFYRGSANFLLDEHLNHSSPAASPLTELVTCFSSEGEVTRPLHAQAFQMRRRDCCCRYV